MNAHRIDTVLSSERLLTLRDLPFTPGTPIEVIILEREVSVEPPNRYPLRGTAYRYDTPFEAVAAEEWEAAK